MPKRPQYNRHRRFNATTKSGLPIHVYGNPDMKEETLTGLCAMADQVLVSMKLRDFVNKCLADGHSVRVTITPKKGEIDA